MHTLMQPLRLWPSHGQRRATWMELFFDLIFVAAISEVSKSLSADFTLAGVVRFSFLFVLIWWSWLGHTLFSTRFDSDDFVHRALILLQCFIAAVMAANSREALDSRSAAGFGAAYAGMRVLLVLQYVRAAQIGEARAMASRFAAGFGLAAIVWIASSLTDPPLRYVLWSSALAIDIFTPWLAERHCPEIQPHAEHFPERFGLFTIILIGEFVAEVMRGIGTHEYWSVPAATTAFAGMAFAFLLRWWYFDIARAADERHVRTSRDRALFQVWNYGHAPFLLATGIAAVGFKHLIALQGNAHMHAEEAWILMGSSALLMASMSVVAAASRTAPRRRVLSQLGVAMLIANAGMVGHSVSKVVLALLLVTACLLLGFLGATPATKLAARSAVA
jgi:low temperature requirement protein LtrA